MVFEKEYCISCDAHLLNELLETDVPWDDAIVVSAGKLRKLWHSSSELRSSLCDRRLESTVLRPALLPVKTAQFTQFFRQVWRHNKIAQFNWECIWGLIRGPEVLGTDGCLQIGSGNMATGRNIQVVWGPFEVGRWNFVWMLWTVHVVRLYVRGVSGK